MTRAPIDHQRRDDILAAAAIRAMLCASRGLSQSQACHPPGCEMCSPPISPCVCADVRHMPADDSEGGVE